jgi:hypothetical protein
MEILHREFEAGEKSNMKSSYKDFGFSVHNQWKDEDG